MGRAAGCGLRDAGNGKTLVPVERGLEYARRQYVDKVYGFDDEALAQAWAAGYATALRDTGAAGLSMARLQGYMAGAKEFQEAIATALRAEGLREAAAIVKAIDVTGGGE